MQILVDESLSLAKFALSKAANHLEIWKLDHALVDLHRAIEHIEQIQSQLTED